MMTNSPYGAALKVKVELQEADGARIRIPYADEIANPGGALHGGVIASAIDIAGVLAAYDESRESPRLASGTLDLDVVYLAAAIREDVIAEARVLRRGKEISFSQVEVRNEGGKKLAAGLVTHRAVEASDASMERQLPGAPMILPPPADELIRGAKMFVSFGFMARLGMQVAHAHGGAAALVLPAQDELRAAVGLHEGALAALIDTAGALAAWSVVGLDLSYKASTVGIHVNYWAPALGDVIARACVRRRDREIFFSQVEVSETASQRLVASAVVTYRIIESQI